VATVYTSNAIAVAGLGASDSASVSVTGGTYSKNGGAFTSAAGNAVNGDTFAVRVTSSASEATQTDVVLTIGATSDTYSVTTATSSIIDNGDFASSSGWTLTGDAAISGGVLTITSSGSASRDTNTALVPGNFYKVTFTITAGFVPTNLTLGGGPGTAGPSLSAGTNTLYVLAGSANQTLFITGGNSFDNISVVPASSSLSSEYIQNGGFDDDTNWSLGTSIDISGGTVNWTSASNLRIASNTTTAGIEAGAYYLATFTITSFTSGIGRIRIGSSSGTGRNSAATFTQPIIATDTTAAGLTSGQSNTTFSADNYSVKKVTFS
jgi:hypothetical protein